MPRSTVSTSREFRPLRWLGLAALACVISYLVGTVSTTPTVAPQTPPACTR
ncbi:hypothetical protein [Solihabitans fulvus]|uniref:hypothetical protein n=1 Tax=Solihabitans fulvus TaxID=1892852 RepID=UPI0016618DB6|nr:hypothetical protein [Solihabitans fulvus]